jgi:hypothetical protein
VDRQGHAPGLRPGAPGHELTLSCSRRVARRPARARGCTP